MTPNSGKSNAIENGYLAWELGFDRGVHLIFHGLTTSLKLLEARSPMCPRKPCDLCEPLSKLLVSP